MRRDLFQTGFSKTAVQPLPDEAVDKLISFATGAFGCSEWVALRGGKKPYYFNFDKAYSRADARVASDFHNLLATFIQNIWHANKPDADALPPILAYVCPGGAPAGIVQARGALSERLGWQSVLVFPDKRLLRSRVIVGESSDTYYPDSVKWISGRQSFLLADAVTTGESIARAAGAMRAFNCEPMTAIAIYNREEGADESLATIRLPLYALLTRSIVKDLASVDERTREAIRTSHHKIVRDLSIYASNAG
jgi:hypothetical protein